MSEIRKVCPHPPAPSPTAWAKESSAAGARNAPAIRSVGVPPTEASARSVGVPPTNGTTAFPPSAIKSLSDSGDAIVSVVGEPPTLRSATAGTPSYQPPTLRSATAGTPSHPQRDPALLKACQEFESLFILQLWRAMQRTLPSQPKTLNYTEMFDVQFADHLAKHGRFGLAEQLYEQLSRFLPSPPSPLSRDAGEGEPSSPSPTPWERGLGGEGTEVSLR